MSVRRVTLLWACIVLFLLRVVGQLEVLLVAPAWLPPMNDWYSGLIPYPMLLPVQIVILMGMTAVTVRALRVEHSASVHSGRWRPWVCRIAIVYFALMLLRLLVQLLRGADDVVEAGGIPVAFHWVLALFLLVLARRNSTMGRLACLPAQKGEAA